jgi:hypothetical protein
MNARLLAAGLASCLLIALLTATGCGGKSKSGAETLSLGGGVSSGLDFMSAVFGDSLKTSTSPEGEDTDLKAALLVENDLPPGYARPAGLGDMRLTADTPVGSMRAIMRQFAQLDPANPARGSFVMAMAYSGLPGKGELNAEEEKKAADKAGLYESTEVIDTSGLGENSSGLRQVMGDLGVMEMFMWFRGDLTYALWVMYPKDWPTPPDGVALARIMDDRASGKSQPPTPNPLPAAVPTAIAGADALTFLFGGPAPKVEMNGDKPDPDLTAPLLDEDDLPEGFANFMGDMHLTFDLTSGPVDAAARMFMKYVDKDPVRGMMLMEYATAASIPKQTGCEDMVNAMSQAGTFKSVEALDASGLGDSGCGVRTVSDFGVMDTYVWSRGGREYELILSTFGGSSQSLDGLALAKTMDGRAQEISN